MWCVANKWTEKEKKSTVGRQGYGLPFWAHVFYTEEGWTMNKKCNDILVSIKRRNLLGNVLSICAKEVALNYMRSLWLHDDEITGTEVPIAATPPILSAPTLVSLEYHSTKNASKC